MVPLSRGRRNYDRATAAPARRVRGGPSSVGTVAGDASWDLRPFVAWIVGEYEPSVRVDARAGAYASRPGGDQPELYGIADLACVLHTLGRLHPTDAQRREWADAFAAFQDAGTGNYVERGPASHVELHATAYAIAAMQLLDLEPRYPLAFLDPHRPPASVAGFVDGLDWRSWVYLESHRGAGLGSVMAIAGAVDPSPWFDAYFRALESHLDPVNGMFGDDKPPEGDLDQIGGTFHYAFLYEWAHRRLPYASARIDSVLALQRDGGLWDEANPLWLTLDGAYLLTRGMRHSAYRRVEVEAAVAGAVETAASVALDPAARAEVFGGPMGTHALVAVLSLLAEAQDFLGAEVVVTGRPLGLVLDRRPFV